MTQLKENTHALESTIDLDPEGFRQEAPDQELAFTLTGEEVEADAPAE